ncbi:hypothetical protein LIER_15262 [Lithospermum erythrorhizon]|uniref:Uncharacterized protein n=1 Tax=Lithospermum erythrorhizon TaxID=34254 RepID=A0AAV3Q5D7_LITER
MDAAIINSLLQCSLCEVESKLIRLDVDDLANGIIKCEFSMYATILSLKESFVSIQSVRISLSKAWNYQDLRVSRCPSLESSSDPKKECVYDLWIKAPVEKTWVVFRLNDESEDANSKRWREEQPRPSGVISTPASQHSLLRDNSDTPVLGKMSLPKMLCPKLGHGDKEKDLDKGVDPTTTMEDPAILARGKDLTQGVNQVDLMEVEKGSKSPIISNQLEIKDVHDKEKIHDRGTETDASFP